MYLQNKIKSLLLSDNLNLYDFNGKQVDTLKLKNEYLKIKNYLLLNFSTDDCISICLTKDYKYLLVILACIEIGLTYIPIKDSLPKDRINQICKLANVKEVIDDEIFKKMLDCKDISDIETFDISPKKALYIIFTSGSTGEPKGVVIKRESCENFFMWIDEYFVDLNDDTRLLQMADFSFDMSVLDIGILLTKQARIFFTNFNGDIFKLAYEIENFKISCIATVPNNFNILLSDGIKEKINLTSLKAICIGGARFSFGLYKKMTAYFDYKSTNIYNFYGPTEATVYVTVHKIKYIEDKDSKNHNISIGSPIKNTLIKITNLDKQLSKEGEMYIGGIQVMKEYISNIEKTNESLINIENEIYYKTGDISFMDDEGKYYIVGRLDDTIKRKGYRINTLDIDSYIQKIDGVLDSVSIAIPDEILENKLITYIQSNDTNLESIKLKMKDILADYQIPDQIKHIDNFPLNSSGKVCKKTLAKQ